MTPHWNVLTVLMVVGVGFVAGFFNTLAGGGSLLTLPLLIFLGIPAPVANGTNRVALLLQNVAGIWGFARGGARHLRTGALLSLTALAGAMVGVSVAVRVPAELLERVIGILLIVVGAYVLVRPERWTRGGQLSPARRRWLLGGAFLLIGLYGGFIQAGIGFFILTVLVLWGGYDLIHANAIKLTVVLIYTIPVLVVFALHDQVDWTAGLLLAVGNVSGAWIASHLGVRKGAGWVRGVLVVALLLAAVRLLVGR
jgi:hypothetical protein